MGSSTKIGLLEEGWWRPVMVDIVAELALIWATQDVPQAAVVG